MTGIEDLLSQLMVNVDGAVLTGLVDRVEGSVISVIGRELVSTELEAAFLSATVEALERPHREDLLGPDSELDSTEVQIQDERVRYFAKTLNDGRRVMALVTERGANAGLSWPLLRAMTLRAETEIPVGPPMER